MTLLYWTPEAVQDRDSIYDYIQADNPAAAIAMDELFEKNTRNLTDHPQMGRIGRVEGTRELVVHHHYVVVYDLVGGAVRVLRWLHTARRWPLQN